LKLDLLNSSVPRRDTFLKLKPNGRRLLIIAGALVAAAVAFCFTYSEYLNRPTSSFTNDFSALIKAISAYATAHPNEDWVSLKQLEDGGYISHRDLGPFARTDLTINTRAEATRPQQPMSFIRLSNGQAILQLGDGSVQQVRSERIKVEKR